MLMSLKTWRVNSSIFDLSEFQLLLLLLLQKLQGTEGAQHKLGKQHLAISVNRLFSAQINPEFLHSKFQ